MNLTGIIKINKPQGEELERYLSETQKQADMYKEIFERLIAEKPELTLKKRGSKEVYDTIYYVDGEEWRQCFSREDRGRWEFPPYHFISDKTGFVISVKHTESKGDYLQWLSYDPRKDGTFRYHFHHPWAEKGESVKVTSAHIIQALVFPDKVSRSPLANKRIQKHGLLAFCQGTESDNVNHIKTKKRHPDLINDVSALQVITEELHLLLAKAPKITSKRPMIERETKFVQKLLEQIKKEYGDISVAVLAGLGFKDDGRRIFNEDVGTVTMEKINSIIFKQKDLERILGCYADYYADIYAKKIYENSDIVTKLIPIMIPVGEKEFCSLYKFVRKEDSYELTLEDTNREEFNRIVEEFKKGA